jgi:hypothetical protein
LWSVYLATVFGSRADMPEEQIRSPQRGVPRTAAHLELDGMLEELLKHFVSEMASAN